MGIDMQLFHCDSATYRRTQKWMGDEKKTGGRSCEEG